MSSASSWAIRSACKRRVAHGREPTGPLCAHLRCCDLVRRGVSKEAIGKMLGHHSWHFTASTYLHLNDDDLPETEFLDALDDGSGGVAGAGPSARERCS